MLITSQCTPRHQLPAITTVLMTLVVTVMTACATDRVRLAVDAQRFANAQASRAFGARPVDHENTIRAFLRDKQCAPEILEQLQIGPLEQSFYYLTRVYQSGGFAERYMSRDADQMGFRDRAPDRARILVWSWRCLAGAPQADYGESTRVGDGLYCGAAYYYFENGTVRFVEFPFAPQATKGVDYATVEGAFDEDLNVFMEKRDPPIGQRFRLQRDESVLVPPGQYFAEFEAWAGEQNEPGRIAATVEAGREYRAHTKKRELGHAGGLVTTGWTVTRYEYRYFFDEVVE